MMGMIDYIIIAVILLILGAAGLYVYKAKKSGKNALAVPIAATAVQATARAAVAAISVKKLDYL